MKLNIWHKKTIEYAIKHGHALKHKTWSNSVYKELWELGILERELKKYRTHIRLVHGYDESIGVYYLKDKKMAQKILSLFRQKKSDDIEIEIVESDERD